MRRPRPHPVSRSLASFVRGRRPSSVSPRISAPRSPRLRTIRARSLAPALTALGLLLSGAAGAATITVDGVCSLADAIRSANSDVATGGCVAGSGDDTLVLDVDVVLASAETTDSDELFGDRAGLPDIRSVVRIEAGLASTIERDAALSCLHGGLDHFRLLQAAEPAASLTLSGLTLRNGCAGVGGGVLVDSFATLVVEDSVFVGNTALPPVVDPPPNEDRGGGAIADYGAQALEIRDSRFESNQVLAEDGPDGAEASGGAVLSHGSCIGIERTLFRDNRAMAGAGASGDGADGLGGAVWVDSLGFFDDVRFEENQAVGGVGRDRGGDAAGGALWTRGFCPGPASLDLVFLDNLAAGNSASSGRGGLAAGGAFRIQNPGSPGTVIGLVAHRNRALGGDSEEAEGGEAVGGAFSGWELTVERASFEENLAAAGDGSDGGRSAGGAVDLEQGSLFQVSAHGNQAIGGDGTNGDGGRAVGGGICMRAGVGGSSFGNGTLADNLARGGESLQGGTGGRARGGGLAAAGALDVFRLDQTTIVGNRAEGGAGPVAGIARGGGLEARSDVTFKSSILAANTSRDGGAAAFAEDCWTDGAITTDGFNRVEAAGVCLFVAATDQAGATSGLGPYGRYGCAVTLPDGRCPGAVPLALGSPAVDQGSCAAPGTAVDIRGLSRPVDFPGIADLDDGCDVGSYEARDEDGDGVEDGGEIFEDGFESGDVLSWSASTG